jgi:hypothetical protein
MSLKQAKTIPGTSRGSVTEILSYNPNKDTYKVRFEVDGSGSDDYIDIISQRN